MPNEFFGPMNCKSPSRFVKEGKEEGAHVVASLFGPAKNVLSRSI